MLLIEIPVRNSACVPILLIFHILFYEPHVHVRFKQNLSKLTRLNMVKISENKFITYFFFNLGAKGDWDFRTSDLVKSPDGTDI